MRSARVNVTFPNSSPYSSVRDCSLINPKQSRKQPSRNSPDFPSSLSSGNQFQLSAASADSAINAPKERNSFPKSTVPMSFKSSARQTSRNRSSYRREVPFRYPSDPPPSFQASSPFFRDRTIDALDRLSFSKERKQIPKTKGNTRSGKDTSDRLTQRARAIARQCSSASDNVENSSVPLGCFRRASYVYTFPGVGGKLISREYARFRPARRWGDPWKAGGDNLQE